jgi:nucleotide-binding universal stress UspA family protein
MTATTIVGWNSTAAADRALNWALTRPAASRIVLVHATDPAVGASTAAVDFFSAHAEHMREAHPNLTVNTELVAGDPVEILVGYTARSSLVVVGTDRERGGGIRYRWSIGARLAAAAHGPVAIVPPGQGGGIGIVVGVDGSPASEAALTFAAEEARDSGATLHAVLGWQEPPIWMDAAVPDPAYLRSLEAMYESVLDDAVKTLAESDPGLHINGTVIRGPAQKVLLDASEDAALIVVGNHGLRGLKRFLLGSVSRSIVLGARCPVVVVPSDEGSDQE